LSPNAASFVTRPLFRDENALACRRAQDGRVERDLTACVDRCDDWLRDDIEPVEATAAGRCQTRSYDGAPSAKLQVCNRCCGNRHLNRGLSW